MKYTLASLLSLLCFLGTQAQYSTPGTGVHWNMDSLVTHSSGAVQNSADGYLVLEDLTISESDSLTNLTFKIKLDAGVTLTIGGYFYNGGFGPIMTSIDSQDIYDGIRIEGTAEAIFDYVRFEGGGGVKCISGDVIFTHCEFRDVQHIETSNAALELFEGSPYVEQCSFENSLGSAISSPANIACSPYISGNFFEGNNTENSNRPQINLGPSGPGGLITLISNTVIGDALLDQVGGIAVASLVGVESNLYAQLNTVIGNRYGLAILGNGIQAAVLDCQFNYNDIQGDPFLGGSGINLNGDASSAVMIGNTVIIGNLWGITVQGDFQVDLGNPDITMDSPGNNTFGENGNGGEIYALYNNTSSPIPAVNNCWIQGQQSTESEVEDVIFHAPDDASLGLVDYSFYQCGIPNSLNESKVASFSLYPNPAQDLLFIESELQDLESYAILDLHGRAVQAGPIMSSSEFKLDISAVHPGLYSLELISQAGRSTQQFVKE